MYKNSEIKLNHAILGLLLLTFSSSSIFLWHSDIPWSDQQRLFQLFFLTLILPTCLAQEKSRLTFNQHAAIATILLIGTISSISSSLPKWAAIEVSRYVALALTLHLVSTNKNSEKIILIIITGTIGLLSSKFLIYYFMAFYSNIRNISTDVLAIGFSNPRFYAQFQAIALPITAMLGIYKFHKKHHLTHLITLSAVSLQWCIAIALGGRGLFLAFGCSYLVLFFLFRSYWQQAAWQLIAFAAGLLIYAFAFHWIPSILNIPEVSTQLIREGLSAREVIWKLALQMTLDNPWLGAGPMHFAAIQNSVAAHPHQMILQWSSEWGIPATLIALYLIGTGMLRGLVVVRSQHSTPVDAALWLSLCNALVLAQVDGVFVMPYSEVWITVIAGLALSRWGQLRTMRNYEKAIINLIATVAFTVLLSVICQEMYVFLDDSQPLPEHYKGFRPRFWTNGWIGQ